MKKFLGISILFITLLLLLPAMLVLFFGHKGDEVQSVDSKNTPLSSVETSGEQQLKAYSSGMNIQVFRSDAGVIEEVPLEEYVLGVVASEMPAEFEIEALKAQALTARTYIVRQQRDPVDVNLPGEAMVSDTPMHQAYKSRDELKELWGSEYEQKIARVEKAVQETAGQVLTYKGEPITAAFFSTSNGQTENSEDYWQNPIPYLKSVESPWDTSSPRFHNREEFRVNEVEALLGVQLQANESGEILSRTEGGRVEKIRIGGQTFSGRDVREALELNSTDFLIERNGETVEIETKGWGHGVGMSQYGADGMAKEGKTYKDIIDYYYQGVEISQLNSKGSTAELDTHSRQLETVSTSNSSS